MGGRNMENYAVLEQGHQVFVGTYEECCEYLDNVYYGWETGTRLLDVGIIPYAGEEE